MIENASYDYNTQPSEFRELKQKNVYHIQEEVKMRGIDYQAEVEGIELLICAPFSNERAYQQALNRVGRNGQPCTRYIIKDLTEFVDEAKENILR